MANIRKYDEDENFPVEVTRTPFDVPYPWLKIDEDPIWGNMFGRGVKLYMSGDGEHWTSAWFPHVEDGSLSGCMQQGTFGIDFNDVVGNIANYVVNYVNAWVCEYWCDVFDIGTSFSHGGSSRFWNERTSAFMEQWEKMSVEQFCEAVNKKAGIS